MRCDTSCWNESEDYMENKKCSSKLSTRKSIVVLHVFTDDKFFDSVSEFWDTLDGVENLYYFYSSKKKYVFKYIRKTDKIVLFSDYKKYVENFSDEKIDVVYFQSMPPSFYKYFRYISDDKKVVWWCFGYELYDSFAWRKPLLKISLYRPLTKKYLRKNILLKFLHEVIQILKYPIYFFYRNRIIRRIDYFSPVLPIEYRLLKSANSFFTASPFMLAGGWGYKKIENFHSKQNLGNILIGNSLTYTNNHLDVLEQIKKCELNDEQKIILPINYGNATNKYKKYLMQFVGNDDSYIWLEEMLPREQYFNILESVTHAVFGVMRQQAIGNIRWCLYNGIKVYLYADSLVYCQLKEQGYYVYSIEEDLNRDTLGEQLGYNEAYHNYCLVVNNSEMCKQQANSDLAGMKKNRVDGLV